MIQIPMTGDGEHPTLDRLAAAIRDARRQRNVSEAEVARAMGVDQTTYSGWERGRWRPRDDDKLAELERVLAVEPGDLLRLAPPAKRAGRRTTTTRIAEFEARLERLEATLVKVERLVELLVHDR